MRRYLPRARARVSQKTPPITAVSSIRTSDHFLSLFLFLSSAAVAFSRFRRFISAVLRLAQSRDRGITHLRSVAFAAIKLSLYAASFILGELYPLERWRIYSRYARRRYFRREAARHLSRTVRRLWRKPRPMFLSTWYFVCVPVNPTGRYCASLCSYQREPSFIHPDSEPFFLHRSVDDSSFMTSRSLILIIVVIDLGKSWSFIKSF